jgi:hypothetical protein
MGRKSGTKGRTTRRTAAKDQADAIKGGLLPAIASPATRRTKNEVAIESLEIAHEGHLPSPS